MIQRTRALAAFSSAKEYASIQRAVIAAALPGQRRHFGNLSENDRQYGALGAARTRSPNSPASPASTGATPPELTKPHRRAATRPSRPPTTTPERVLEPARTVSSTRDKRSYLDWVDADSARYQQMSNIELTLLNEMEQKARELRNEAEQRSDHLRCADPAGPRCLARRRLRRGPLHDPLAAPAPGHRDQGRPGPAARAGQAALRVRPAGRRHLRRVGRCALPGRDRPGGRGLRRRAPRGRTTRRRAGPPARQRQRDVHQPLAPLPGPHPASALAHLRTGVPRGRPGPAVLALQARPPRDPHAP